MAESYVNKEARISKAYDALKRFEKPNIARAARDFHVNKKGFEIALIAFPPSLNTEDIIKYL
jgi:hypothetical protein